MSKIDFVVTWVDGNDKDWLEDKAKYSSTGGDVRNIRFQDWDQLKYWFRAIEKNAPWVNKIHFVTYGHIPNWLNVNHEKINIVNHSDFIPKEYLPVFNSTAIEVHLHRIPNLSENFVYFCDDFYLMQKCKEEDFFIKNLPADMALLSNALPHNGEMYFYHLYNDYSLYSHYLDKRIIMRNIFKYINLKYGNYNFKNAFNLLAKNVYFSSLHIPMPLLKSSLETIWKDYEKEMKNTANSKFRQITNNSLESVRGYQLITGKFYPISKKWIILDTRNIQKAVSEIVACKYKFICLSDNTSEEKFEETKLALNNAFEKIFPDRSAFEREN